MERLKSLFRIWQRLPDPASGEVVHVIRNVTTPNGETFVVIDEAVRAKALAAAEKELRRRDAATSAAPATAAASS